MKHVKLYETYLNEKYVTYDDLNWVKSPSDIEDEIRSQIINLFTYAGISDNLDDLIFTDQSSDKGIKWEIKIVGKGTDVIHVYKDGKMRGQYEWYLNKKKSSKYDIQQYFLNKYVSELDRYLAALKAFDYTYQYSDDSKKYKRGSEQSQNLKELYNKLSNADKKKAAAAYSKRTKKKVDYKSFQGA